MGGLPVESELSEVVNKYSEQGVDEGLFERMRQELEGKGLEEFMPKAVSLVVEGLHDKNK
mgnify:CR=1 FL=1